MIYEFRFSTDPEEDPEVLKMLIEADNRSDLLYNILNSKWDTEQLYFDEDDINDIMDSMFVQIMNDLKSNYQDLYGFLMRCQFKLDLRKFLGENNEDSLKKLLHIFGRAICSHLCAESGGFDYEYEFLKR